MQQARLLLLGPLPPALLKQQEKLQPLFVLKGVKTPIFSVCAVTSVCMKVQKVYLLQLVCAVQNSNETLLVPTHTYTPIDVCMNHSKERAT